MLFRSVELGPRAGEDWIVEKGVEAGQRVIVEGLQKARPGTIVTPKPSPQPKPSPEKPDDKSAEAA